MSNVYDAVGRMISSADARNNTTTYEYDEANRRTAVVDALGNRHEYTYDAAGNITEEVDARGNAVSFVYNETPVARSFNRLITPCIPPGVEQRSQNWMAEPVTTPITIGTGSRVK